MIKIKQKKGFEPSTLILARLYSTNWVIFAYKLFFNINKEFNNINNSLLFFTFVWIEISIGGIFLNFINSVFNSKKYKTFLIWKFKIFLFFKLKLIWSILGKIK